MTITLTREEAQQVLDALEEGLTSKEYRALVETLRARLSAPEPEPVAWFTEDHREDKSATTYSKKMAGRWKEKGWPVTPLYTTPPQGNEPNYRDVVIKGDLWRIEFLPDHAVSVVLVRANYEAQPEPPCKTGSQCIGGKCPQCVVSEPEPVAWMNESDMGRTDWKVWAHGKPTATIPLYTAPPHRKPWDNKVLITDEYERGVIDGMQKQMQSSVDKAVNKMAKREWQGLTDEEKNKITWGKTVYEILDLAEAKLKEKNA